MRVRQSFANERTRGEVKKRGREGGREVRQANRFQAAVIMDQFIHLPEFQVIICKKCKYAVLPSQIDSHFTPRRPHGLVKQERERIAKEVVKVDGLIWDTEALKQCEFPFPVDTAEPIVALQAPQTNGFRCTFETDRGFTCQYVCKTIKKLQVHSWEKHQWKAPRGRPKRDAAKPANMPWRSGVSYQRFFVQGPRSGFFEVGRGVGEQLSGEAEETRWEKLEKAIDQGMSVVDDIQQRKIKATDESKEPNPWLRRTGWARHLGGFDREELRALVRPVEAEKDPELVVTHKAFHQLIRQAQKNAVSDVVGRAALFEAHRKEQGKKPKKPFNSRMDKTTFRQYTGYWNQLLSYMVRTDDLDEEKRPKFKFTSKQQDIFDELMDAVDQIVEFQGEKKGKDAKAYQELEKYVRDRLLQFCIALLDHELADNEYQSVIISGLAVLGLQEGGRWANAEDYTPKLSAVIKLARLMVIQNAYEIRQQSIAKKVGRGMSQVDAGESTRSHVKLVQAMTRKFMILTGDDGDPTPMDWILETRTYGLHIRYSTPAEGTVSWKGETILYQEIQFTMEQVRGMVHGLVAETRRGLIEDLLILQLDPYEEVKGQRLPPIDWARIVDNFTEQQVGWSFLKDSRNRFDIEGVDGRKWLTRRIVSEPELAQRFIRSEGQGNQPIQWKKEAIEQYQRTMERFQEKLLVLMHFTGGQAARAPEIIGIRHCNTTNGGVRNIFIDDGLVMFVTAYHKGYEFSEKTKLIQRFLPREVGELLVYFLWLVLPFWESIQVVVDGVVELSPFVWGDAKIGDEKEGKDIRGEENEAEIRPADPDADVPDVDIKAGDVEESGVCRPKTRWTSERMRRIIQRESMKWIGKRLNISAWRQIVIAIARRFLRDKFGFEGDDDDLGGSEDFDEDNHEGDSAWDLQSGHGTRIAGLIYARLLSEGRFETKSQRERFRQVSQEWHQFLGFASSQAGFGVKIGQKRKQSHWDQVNREMRLYRWKQLREVNIYRRLEALQGPGAKFRGTQEPAINAIMMGHSPVVMIAGTGTGKTMAIMLPASSVSGGTTIAIVPLCALQGNLQERCETAQISSIIWSSQRPHDSASIVFVTPESAVTKTFAGFMNRLQEMHRLDRIVFDEWHTMLDGSPSFRPTLRDLGKLALRGVQMVYLTATLPPREEEEIYRLAHIRRGQVYQFRGCTTRPNVAYQVKKVDLEEVDEEEEEDILGLKKSTKGFGRAIEKVVLALVAEKLEQFPAPGKIIIYSSSVDGADSLGKALGCEVYHRTVDTRDGKARRLKDWMDGRGGGLGEGRVIIATNALGLGIDVPDIRVVVHVGYIRNLKLKNYGQESGRAGRDGGRSEAIIMLPVRDGKQVESVVRDERGWVDIQEFVQGDVCRRVILDQVMDGRIDREECEEGEEPCDVCWERKREQERAVLRARIIRQLEKEEHDNSGVVLEPVREEEASSEVSFDQGFRYEREKQCPGAVSGADELQFNLQEQQREWTQHRVITQRREEAWEVQKLEEYLEQWTLQCPLCVVRRCDSYSHSIEDCPQEGASTVREGIVDLQEQIQFERFSCCFYCHVPQAICQRWEPGEENIRWQEVPGQRCQFEGVVMPAIISALHVEEQWVVGVMREMAQEEGSDIQADGAVYQWLGKRVEWGGVEASRLLQVFYKISRALE